MMSQIPIYNTETFSDIFPDAETFVEEYGDAGIPALISETSATTLYYLLYARYGNSPIANFDINQWKYKCWSIIFQYGPTWEKRLAIQQDLRELEDADLLQGAKAIYNSALNPETSPSTGELEELEYINQQNTTNYKRSILDAYQFLWDLLRVDVSENFLKAFRPLFKKVVAPERPILYESEEEE